MEILPYLGAFASYFGVAAVAVCLFGLVYSKITPHDEIALIKQNNTAAGIAFSGALMGYIIAISGVVENAVSLMDLAVWAVVALGVQLLAFLAVRMALPKIVDRVKDNETSAAIVLAAISIGAGYLNAACMTY